MIWGHPRYDSSELYLYIQHIMIFVLGFKQRDLILLDQDEMERGDVPKSIQCYMNEKGVSEEDARKHINLLIKETWKLMNTALQKENSLFSETFIACAVNGARTSHTIYQHGDGYGIQNLHTKNRIRQLFFEPITISIP